MSDQINNLLATLQNDKPFDISWARSVLPDGRNGVTIGKDFYKYKDVIGICVGERDKNTVKTWMIAVDDETLFEMRTRAQFLALCFGLGIEVQLTAGQIG